MSKREMMVKAHKIAKNMEGDYAARMSYALKVVWAEAKASEADIRVELPELTGSEKQIAWANDIRKNYVEAMYNYINSDADYMSGEVVYWNNSFDRAKYMYEDGITCTEWVSLRERIWKDGHKLGFTGLKLDEYEEEHSPIKKARKERPGSKEKAERLAFDKALLKQIFEETLKIETKASNWINAFKHSRYNTYYCKNR